jgi:hypothetical protein
MEVFWLAGRREGGRMGIIRKYAFELVLALAVIYAYAPLSLVEYVAKLRWLDDINVIVNKSLAPAKPEAGVSPVDPIAAANVDEDLDYRIAQRMKSTEGWRSFLAAHPVGPMRNLRARNSTNYFRSRGLMRLRLPKSRMVGRRTRKLRARTAHRTGFHHGPRLPPMKSANATRIVSCDCPARQETKRCVS